MNLAPALQELDRKQHRDEADLLLLLVIEAQPFGELANKAKGLRGSIAPRDLWQEQQDVLRQDAASHCLQALQMLEGMEQYRSNALISEVASLGQGALRSTNRTPPARSRTCLAPGAT